MRAEFAADSPYQEGERKKRRAGFAVFLSVLLHCSIILLAVVGIDFGRRAIIDAAPPSEVIEAHAVPQAALDQAAEERAAALRRQREADMEKRREAERRLAEIKAEQARLEEQKREAQEAEAAAQEAQRVRREKAAEAARKKAQEARLAAEKKRLAEEAQRQAAAAKKKAEAAQRAAQQRRLEEARRKEQSLQDALAQEEAALAAAAQAREDKSMIARYTVAIRNQVASAFVYPDLTADLKCTLLVRTIPGGEVIVARVVKSSGNPLFDRQAETAVRKASPLPVPSEARLFETFREFRLLFDPE